MRVFLAGCALALTVGLLCAPTASATTIEDMVNNTGARESPFWSYMADNGFGYLDAQQVNNDSRIACANRQAGVTPSQIAGLLESRGYTTAEAQAIVTAEQVSSTSIHSVC